LPRSCRFDPRPQVRPCDPAAALPHRGAVVAVTGGHSASLSTPAGCRYARRPKLGCVPRYRWAPGATARGPASVDQRLRRATCPGRPSPKRRSATEARAAGSRPRPIVRPGRRAPGGACRPCLRWPVPPSRQSRRVRQQPKLLPGPRASRRRVPVTVAAGAPGRRSAWFSRRRPCTARAVPDRGV
jgi:hypothetical protein